MKKLLSFSTGLALALLGTKPAAAQHFVDFKSPGAGMHFTEGMPIVVFLDLFDGPGSGFGSIVNGVGWPQGQVLVDGVALKDDQSGSTTIAGPNTLDTNGNPEPIDMYRLVGSGVTAGTHQLVARGLFQDGSSADSAPISITVDAWPSGKTAVTLQAGDNPMADLVWDNVAVRGNGGTLTVTGKVTIKNSLITGVETITSADGAVSAVDIEDSIFEDTGVVKLVTSGAMTFKNNEFRANNRLTFANSDPSVPLVLDLGGSSADKKLFQGNRLGAGIVSLNGMSNWLIGGDTDAESNIMIGPRSVYNIVNSSNVTLRGNYSHHNYRGGWSQGFNFYFYGSSDGIVVEHNLIRSASWPVQDLGGEFRYNVVYGYGHNWVRSASTGASIHHNLFVPEGSGQFGGGFFFYKDESGLEIYNNTFDCGGNDTGDCGGPMILLNGTTQVASLRNNLFTYSRNMENSPGGPAITATDQASYLSADYNAFYSPDNDTKHNYDITIAGKTEGGDGFGGHDVSAGGIGVIDGQLASSPFAGKRILPYESVVDEASVWNRTQPLSAILAAFRARYTPAAGSPIINAGDPQDNDSTGRRTDIGAIDVDGHDQDQLGKFGPQTDAGTPDASTALPDGSTAAPAGGASDKGCGCMVPGSHRTPLPLLAVAAVFSIATLRRGRSERARKPS